MFRLSPVGTIEYRQGRKPLIYVSSHHKPRRGDRVYMIIYDYILVN